MGKYDDLNSVLLEGRLVKDPILKEFSNQSMICNFSIANNFSFKMKDGKYKSDATFIDIKVWGRSGQLCNQYLKKGSIVRLRGRITQDRWEDESGYKKSRIFVTAGHVEFRQTTVEKKTNNESDGKIESVAKDVVNQKQNYSQEDVVKQKAVFTKIIPNKKDVLQDDDSNSENVDIPF